MSALLFSFNGWADDSDVKVLGIGEIIFGIFMVAFWGWLIYEKVLKVIYKEIFPSSKKVVKNKVKEGEYVRLKKPEQFSLYFNNTKEEGFFIALEALLINFLPRNKSLKEAIFGGFNHRWYGRRGRLENRSGHYYPGETEKVLSDCGNYLCGCGDTHPMSSANVMIHGVWHMLKDKSKAKGNYLEAPDLLKLNRSLSYRPTVEWVTNAYSVKKGRGWDGRQKYDGYENYKYQVFILRCSGEGKHVTAVEVILMGGEDELVYTRTSWDYKVEEKQYITTFNNYNYGGAISGDVRWTCAYDDLVKWDPILGLTDTEYNKLLGIEESNLEPETKTRKKYPY